MESTANNTVNNIDTMIINIELTQKEKENLFFLHNFEREGILMKNRVGKNISNEVTEKMRSILIDWLGDVNRMFKTRYETYELTISLLDIILQKIKVSRDKLQLYGVTCLMIAGKKEEIYPPEVEDHVYICDSAYTKKEIIQAELEILEALNYNLEIPSTIIYLRFISSCGKATYCVHTHAKLLCVCFKYSRKGGDILPSVIATAAYNIVSSFDKNYTLSDNNDFVNPFGIDEKTIIGTMILICKCYIKMSSSTLFSNDIIEKHFAKGLNAGDIIKYIRIANEKLNKYNIKYTIKDEYKISTHEKNKSVHVFHNSQIYKIEKIGGGTYGCAHRVNVKPHSDISMSKQDALTLYNKEHINKDNFDYSAIYVQKKSVYNIFDETNDYKQSFIREVSILASLAHKNIIGFYGVVKHQEILILENMDSDINTFIKKYPNIINLQQFRNFVFEELLCGLEYIHSRGIIHRDIKPQNILISGSFNVDHKTCDLTHNFKIKYCDFGLTRGTGLLLKRQNTQEICTLWYRPLELLLAKNEVDYCTEVDVWSLMCSLYEICTDNVLFPGDSEVDMLYKVFQTIDMKEDDRNEVVGNLTIVDINRIIPKISFKEKLKTLKFDNKLIDILLRGLDCIPEKRSSAKELLNILRKKYNVTKHDNIMYKEENCNLEDMDIEMKSPSKSSHIFFTNDTMCIDGYSYIINLQELGSLMNKSFIPNSNLLDVENYSKFLKILCSGKNIDMVKNNDKIRDNIVETYMNYAPIIDRYLNLHHMNMLNKELSIS